MPQKDEIYTLDRVEGDVAVLISSKRERISVTYAEISAKEGDKLQWDGKTFKALSDNGEREEIKARMERLFKRR